MKSPDKIYTPLLGKLMLELCQAIHKECGATGIRVQAEFLYRNGRGDLNLKSFITPDGKTERMLEGGIIMPRGTKLAHDAFSKLRCVVKKVARRKSC